MANHKITFDGFNGEDDQYIRLNGEPVGLLSKDYREVGTGLALEYRVSSYEVVFYEHPDTTVFLNDIGCMEFYIPADRTVDVALYGARRDARYYLREAKKYARTTIKAHLIGS